MLTDKTCQGKALLVIDGNNDAVRNLTLERARVPDGNGAGIRAEGGNLTVSGVAFIKQPEWHPDQRQPCCHHHGRAQPVL